MDNSRLACCFVGHRTVENIETIKNKLYSEIENIIQSEKITTFLFGSKSDFNTLCLEAVTELKKKFPDIKRIYIRAEYPYISDSYYKYLLKYYDETFFPKELINAGRAVYIERNKLMIDMSDFCIMYCDKNYTPKKRRKSGTKLAYDYAVKKNKAVINITN